LPKLLTADCCILTMRFPGDVQLYLHRLREAHGCQEGVRCRRIILPTTPGTTVAYACPLVKTALHKFAKRILDERLEIALPAIIVLNDRDKDVVVHARGMRAVSNIHADPTAIRANAISGNGDSVTILIRVDVPAVRNGPGVPRIGSEYGVYSFGLHFHTFENAQRF
jgi:hypothetical protein